MPSQAELDAAQAAILESATDGISEVEGDQGRVAMESVKDRQDALDRAAGSRSSSLNHRGIYFSKISPPGCG